MNQHSTANDFGTLIEPTTLKIERMLPGPIERVWSYLTDNDLRSQWFASGDMKLEPDEPFEIVWRSDSWQCEIGHKPEGMPDEPRMKCRMISCEPPHNLTFAWGEKAQVSISLKPVGTRVLLTLLHQRIADRSIAVSVSTGWHAHLDLLVALLGNTKSQPFWDHWSSLKKEYQNRIPN